MVEVARVSVQDARENMAGGQALLVCAYDSDEKFSRFHLEGAISLSEFKSRADEISKEQELIFY